VDPAFDIYTVGGIEFLTQAYKGVIMILGNGTYETLLRLVGFLVIAAASTAMIARQSFRQLGEKLLLIVLILGPCIGLKHDIIIHDKQYNMVYDIAGAPYIPAYLHSVLSTASLEITETMETMFHTGTVNVYNAAGSPSNAYSSVELDYSSTGFGGFFNLLEFYRKYDPEGTGYKALISASDKLEVAIRECTLNEIQYWSEDEQMKKVNLSIDLLTTLAPTVNGYVRYKNQDTDCISLYTAATTELADIKTAIESDDLMLNFLQAFDLNPSNKAAFPVALQEALGAAGGSLSSMIIQANTAKVLERATNAFLAEDPDASLAFAYSVGQDVEEWKQTGKSFGLFAGEIIPYLKVGLESLVIIMIPLTFVMIIFGGLAVAKNAVFTIAWIYAWDPILAAINGIANIAAIAKVKAAIAAVTAVNGSLVPGWSQYSITAMNMMYDTVDSLPAVAGYLALSTPTLAYMFIKGGEMAMHGIMNAFTPHGAVGTQTSSGASMNIAASELAHSSKGQSSTGNSLGELSYAVNANGSRMLNEVAAQTGINRYGYSEVQAGAIGSFASSMVQGNAWGNTIEQQGMGNVTRASTGADTATTIAGLASQGNQTAWGVDNLQDIGSQKTAHETGAMEGAINATNARGGVTASVQASEGSTGQKLQSGFAELQVQNELGAEEYGNAVLGTATQKAASGLAEHKVQNDLGQEKYQVATQGSATQKADSGLGYSDYAEGHNAEERANVYSIQAEQSKGTTEGTKQVAETIYGNEAREELQLEQAKTAIQERYPDQKDDWEATLDKEIQTNYEVGKEKDPSMTLEQARQQTLNQYAQPSGEDVSARAVEKLSSSTTTNSMTLEDVVRSGNLGASYNEDTLGKIAEQYPNMKVDPRSVEVKDGQIVSFTASASEGDKNISLAGNQLTETGSAPYEKNGVSISDLNYTRTIDTKTGQEVSFTGQAHTEEGSWTVADGRATHKDVIDNKEELKEFQSEAKAIGKNDVAAGTAVGMVATRQYSLESGNLVGVNAVSEGTAQTTDLSQKTDGKQTWEGTKSIHENTPNQVVGIQTGPDGKTYSGITSKDANGNIVSGNLSGQENIQRITKDTEGRPATETATFDPKTGKMVTSQTDSTSTEKTIHNGYYQTAISGDSGHLGKVYQNDIKGQEAKEVEKYVRENIFKLDTNASYAAVQGQDMTAQKTAGEEALIVGGAMADNASKAIGQIAGLGRALPSVFNGADGQPRTVGIPGGIKQVFGKGSTPSEPPPTPPTTQPINYPGSSPSGPSGNAYPPIETHPINYPATLNTSTIPNVPIGPSSHNGSSGLISTAVVAASGVVASFVAPATAHAQNVQAPSPAPVKAQPPTPSQAPAPTKDQAQATAVQTPSPATGEPSKAPEVNQSGQAPAQGQAQEPAQPPTPVQATSPATGEPSKAPEVNQSGQAPAQGQAQAPAQPPTPAQAMSPSPATGESSKAPEVNQSGQAPAQGQAQEPAQAPTPGQAPSPATGESSKAPEVNQSGQAPAQGQAQAPAQPPTPAQAMSPSPATGEPSKAPEVNQSGQAPAQGQAQEPAQPPTPAQAPSPATGEPSKAPEVNQSGQAPAQGQAQEPAQPPTPAQAMSPSPATGEPSKAPEVNQAGQAPAQGQAQEPAQPPTPAPSQAPSPATGEPSKAPEVNQAGQAPVQGQAPAPATVQEQPPTPSQAPVEREEPTAQPSLLQKFSQIGQFSVVGSSPQGKTDTESKQAVSKENATDDKYSEKLTQYDKPLHEVQSLSATQESKEESVSSRNSQYAKDAGNLPNRNRGVV